MSASPFSAGTSLHAKSVSTAWHSFPSVRIPKRHILVPEDPASMTTWSGSPPLCFEGPQAAVAKVKPVAIQRSADLANDLAESMELPWCPDACIV